VNHALVRRVSEIKGVECKNGEVARNAQSLVINAEIGGTNASAVFLNPETTTALGCGPIKEPQG